MCMDSLCAGMAHYPVGEDIKFFAEFDVPGLPTAPVDGSTSAFIYFNIFFADSKPNRRMNQFVPQHMLGDPLSSSSGPPLYKPIWHNYTSWVFGAQYFFEVFNVTANATEPHAATGPTFPAQQGEVLWTEFTVDAAAVWTLSMGVVGDAARTSVLAVPAPYMGLLAETASWAEPTYDSASVNACWELYGVADRAHYPSTGSRYAMTIARGEAAAAFPWFTNWTEIEEPTCPGAPASAIREAHDDTKQTVLWDISWP